MTVLKNGKLILTFFGQALVVCRGYVTPQPDLERFIDIWIDPDIFQSQANPAEQPLSMTDPCVLSGLSPGEAVAIFAAAVVVFLIITIALCLIIGRRKHWVERNTEESQSFIVKFPVIGKSKKCKEGNTAPGKDSPNMAQRELQDQIRTLYNNMQEDATKVSHRGTDVRDTFLMQIDLLKTMSPQIAKGKVTANKLMSDFMTARVNADKLLIGIVHFIKNRDDELRTGSYSATAIREYNSRAKEIQEATQTIMNQCEENSSYLDDVLLPMLADLHDELNQYELLAKNSMRELNDFCDKWRDLIPVVPSTHQTETDDTEQLHTEEMKNQLCEVSNVFDACCRVRHIIDELRNKLDGRLMASNDEDEPSEQLERARSRFLKQRSECGNIEEKLTELTNSFNKLCRDSLMGLGN